MIAEVEIVRLAEIANSIPVPVFVNEDGKPLLVGTPPKDPMWEQGYR